MKRFLFFLLITGCIPIPPIITPTPTPFISPSPEPTIEPTLPPTPEPSPIPPAWVNISGINGANYCEFLITPQIASYCADWPHQFWQPLNSSPFLWANYGLNYEGWPGYIQNASSYFYIINASCEYGNWRKGTFYKQFLWNFSKKQLLNLSLTDFKDSPRLALYHWCIDRAAMPQQQAAKATTLFCSGLVPCKKSWP